MTDSEQGVQIQLIGSTIWAQPLERKAAKKFLVVLYGFRICQLLFLSLFVFALYTEMTKMWSWVNLSSIDPFITSTRDQRQFVIEFFLTKNILCQANNVTVTSCHEIELDDKFKTLITFEYVKIIFLSLLILHAVFLGGLFSSRKASENTIFNFNQRRWTLKPYLLSWISMIVLCTTYGALNIAMDRLFLKYCHICQDENSHGGIGREFLIPIGGSLLIWSLCISLSMCLFCKQNS
jgi:hypothetical protein